MWIGVEILCLDALFVLVFSDAGEDSSLSPYVRRHGSRLSYRSLCEHRASGSAPHEVYAAHRGAAPPLHRRFVRRWEGGRTLRGHLVRVEDPGRMLTVLEPRGGGCEARARSTVADTAQGRCIVATNAGYFDTKQGNCLGNVVGDSKMVHNSGGIQNAHFGLTRDGHIFIGYVSEEQYASGMFTQLVGGVGWILRNGSDFVNASKYLECEDTEETGPMDQFVSILSARTVVGHDKDGRVVIVQIEGKTGVDGISLWEIQDLLKQFGLVNAINMDGGGSSTLVFNGTTVNYPYDLCPDGTFACERNVSTVLCVHAPSCDPSDCSGHGTCEWGQCKCNPNWAAPKCDRLSCGSSNCSGNGVCSEDGCLCHPGYFGDYCHKACSEGWYGPMCAQRCQCINHYRCDAITGACLCKYGFTGDRCQYECPHGYFGLNCREKCRCNGSCTCDAVTGLCDANRNSSLYSVAECLVHQLVREGHLANDDSTEKRRWYATVIVLGVITAACVCCFVLLVFCSCSCYCHNEQLLCRRRHPSRHPLRVPSGELSVSSSDSESVPMKQFETH